MILGRFMLVLGLSLLLVLPTHAIKQRSVQLSESDMELGNDMDTEMELTNEENQGQSIQSDDQNEASVGEMDGDEGNELVEDDEGRWSRKYVIRYKHVIKYYWARRWVTACSPNPSKVWEAKIHGLSWDNARGFHPSKKIHFYSWGHLRCFKQALSFREANLRIVPYRAFYIVKH